MRDKSTMANGFKAAATVEERTQIQLPKQSLTESGNLIRKKDRAGSKYLLNNTILEYLAKEQRKDLVQNNFRMEIPIADNIEKEDFMDVDVTIGLMEHAIKEISQKGSDKGLEVGVLQKELIFTLEAIRETTNVDMAGIFLEVGAFMKESSIKTRGMEKEG